MKNYATIILLIICGFTQCQQPHSLLYKEVHNQGFACVTDDTISFVLPQGDYYYGLYQKRDSLIIVSDNLFSDRNHHIEICECDTSTMEIEMFSLEKHWGYGYVANTDTNLYLERAERIVAFYDNDNQFRVSDTTGKISFNKEELKKLGDTLSLFVFVDGRSFRTEITIPTVPGYKYIVKQKRFQMNPFVTKKGRPYAYNPMIGISPNNKKLFFFYDDQHKIEYNLIDTYGSCFNELHKYYPDL